MSSPDWLPPTTPISGSGRGYRKVKYSTTVPEPYVATPSLWNQKTPGESCISCFSHQPEFGVSPWGFTLVLNIYLTSNIYLCSITLLSHCAQPLCSTTVLNHCAQPLCSATVLSHCAQPLCSTTVLSHCSQPLCSATVLSHCAQPMCPITVLYHCAQSLCSATVLSHCAQSLCSSQNDPRQLHFR